MADSMVKVAAPFIDWMCLKTSENYAPKCSILPKIKKKILGRSTALFLDFTLYLFAPAIPKFWIYLCLCMYLW